MSTSRRICRASAVSRPSNPLPVRQSLAEVPPHVRGVERRELRRARDRLELGHEVLAPRLALADLREQRGEGADLRDRAGPAGNFLLEFGELLLERSPPFGDLGT